MEVPTGILISFGDDEPENEENKSQEQGSAQEEPVAPPRRVRKTRSVSNPNNQRELGSTVELAVEPTGSAAVIVGSEALVSGRLQSMPPAAAADRLVDVETILEQEEEMSKKHAEIAPVLQSKQMSSENPEPVKLCGYLNKLGDKGIIKTYKTRWFVYDNYRCRLYYYRTPQDLIPLGSIDISNASLNFNISTESPGQFHVCSEGRIYQLEAKDKQTKMFWLQELQQRRREYSTKKTSLSKGKISCLTSTSAIQQPTTGLVSTQRIKAKSGDPWTGMPPVLDRVELPAYSVGEATANSNPQTGVFNFSLTNLKTEIRNQMTSLGFKRNPPTSLDVSGYSHIIPEQEESSQISGIESSIANEATSPITESSQTDQTKQKGIVGLKAGFMRIESSIANEATSPITESSQTDQTKQKGIVGLKAGFMRKLTRTPSDASPTSSAVWFENQRNGCQNCAKLQIEVSSLKEELEVVEGEVQASKEVINMLHKQLTATQMEKATSALYLDCKTDQQKLMILQRKDKQLIQLEQLLQEMRDDRDTHKEQLRECQRDVDSLKEQTAMFMEMIVAKDEIVMSLTSRVHDLERNEPIHATISPEGKTVFEKRPLTSEFETKNVPSVTTIDHQVHEKLKDKCEAFEMQNRFLNNEILELNHLRQDDRVRENHLIEKYADLEAEYLKTQSKYLLVLDEFKGPQRASQEETAALNTDEIISRLIEEAIKSDALSTIGLVQTSDSHHANSMEGDYDRYGFNRQLEDEGSGDEVGTTLVSKAAAFKKRSEQIQTLRSSTEISVSVKWENYLVTHGDKELIRTPELKSLVRAGIPHEYRARIWKACIDWRVKKDKETTGPGYYENLLNSEKFKSNPATKQIELDLLRTLPNNKHYDNIESPGIPKLRRVLKAFSVHDPGIGYCQGLNRLAAIALLYLDEEDAFWCMVTIIQYIMPAAYYSKTLIGSQTDQRVFKDLLGEKLPRLNAHLDQYEIDLSLITFNWFITIYCDNIPVETMLKIWDTVLYEGNKVLFRFGIAFFKYCEDQLLQLHDYIAIFNFLRTMPSMMSDVQRLTQIAFNELNPFARRHINSKRVFHKQQVKLQLEELERMREEIATNTTRNQDIMSDDEDDYDIVEAIGSKS